MPKYWLMKAEPDSRIVKGKDVRVSFVHIHFSVDDFEECRTTAWEGVRNHEAKNLMKEMQIGDKILFYHSNCKIPGVAGFAKVSKEAYPDYSAWDSTHPYYDAKTDKENPKWFMIDATFDSRAANHVPLALFKWIAALPAAELPEEIAYIGKEGIQAIQVMDLVVRGRLSVQRVNEGAYNAVELLAKKGGWEDLELMKPKATKSKTPTRAPAKPTRKGRSKPPRDASEEDGEQKAEEEEYPDNDAAPAKVKTRTSTAKRNAKKAGSAPESQCQARDEDSSSLSGPPSETDDTKATSRASTRKRKAQTQVEETQQSRPSRKPRTK